MYYIIYRYKSVKRSTILPYRKQRSNSITPRPQQDALYASAGRHIYI